MNARCWSVLLLSLLCSLGNAQEKKKSVMEQVAEAQARDTGETPAQARARLEAAKRMSSANVQNGRVTQYGPQGVKGGDPRLMQLRSTSKLPTAPPASAFEPAGASGSSGTGAK